MLNQIEKRLIKEGLIHAYKLYPHLVKAPVYYLPMKDKEFRDYIPIVKGLHQLNEIPWPDKECIICAEEHINSFFPSLNVDFMVFVIHTNKLKSKYRDIAQIDKSNVDRIEPIQVIKVIHPKNTNIIQTVNVFVEMFHQTNANIKFVDPAISADRAIQEQKENFRSLGKELSKEEENKFREYILKIHEASNEKSFWYAYTEKQKSGIGLASDILCYLSNIVVPCHYVVKSSFAKGFGKPSLKKMTREKPIFSILNYNRIYHHFGNKIKDKDDEVTPHFRRGHIRHHWKLAGLDRFKLPSDPMYRIMLVSQHKVKRTYIPPTWVGTKRFVEKDVIHEILTEEINLVDI